MNYSKFAQWHETVGKEQSEHGNGARKRGQELAGTQQEQEVADAQDAQKLIGAQLEPKDGRDTKPPQPDTPAARRVSQAALARLSQTSICAGLYFFVG